jgi:hypothetical protein
MLCASGFEFEKKLHLARVEDENAQRVLSQFLMWIRMVRSASRMRPSAIKGGCRTL